MKQLGKSCDVAMLLIGAGLFISPWILGFGSEVPDLPTQTAVVIGAAIAVSSLATLIAFETWELYIVAAFAAGSITAPWILGIADRTAIVTLVLAGVSALSACITRILLVRRLASAPADRKTSQVTSDHFPSATGFKPSVRRLAPEKEPGRYPQKREY
ncbi:SPW repeat protein [Bradyrhizobium tunisiense]|uniref:SPW repeat protein n=1 Tax=Bradyrhizobium tunisiense TaxID=3278709 RepID=UPI0035D5B364